LIFLTGLLDDLIGLKPWQKILEQLTAAVMAYLGGVQVHLFQGVPGEVWLNALLTIVWLVGCTNAFNLIDGLDGLAAGVGLFATLTMLVAGLTHLNLDLAMVTLPLAAALLAFLRYNFNPASVFLGDCGSLTVGFLLGCFGAIWSHKSATLLGLTAPLIAMAIPLLDAALSIVRRFLRHQPIFGADRGHIHHRLLDRGLRPRSVALLIYAACGVTATFSLLQTSLHQQFGGLIIVLFCIAVWIGIQNLGYVEFATARQMFTKGNFRRIIDSHTRLRVFEETLARSESLDDCWNAICTTCRSMGFSGVRMMLAGRLFEEDFSDDDATSNHWQLRVPIAPHQYINLRREFHEDWISNPILVAAVADILSRLLKEKLQNWAEKKAMEASRMRIDSTAPEGLS
jgi:UDP-GlcNAc:undecaprenyl-phosphate GlcNAc-1-phosphate transferase